ncbi:TetR family transcriptional regulator [Pseudothauera nasutitermitis]|uniref:TetR family transcriptional regulator n=1 Tax=Pseudothauera nasutitermitis TaxID=2565930 RepID=A0A4S4APE6_9RHOO|nr:TetR family transcriptional regulator [Pseudothauera nasutitermitis]THF61523.1 TetR family transcriptional regulator [Pseudothauera nasutitermitis]
MHKPSSAPRTPGRPRGATDCRERLLAAALPAFTRLGFDGAGLRAIAAAAGCDASMVAHHFGGKAGLWRAVVERVALSHDDWLRAAATLAEPRAPVAGRVGALLDSMMDALAGMPDYVNFTLRALAEPEERRGFLVDRLIRPGVEILSPLWREAMAAGVLRPVEPLVLQFALFGACSMVLASREVRVQLGGRELGVEELKAELRGALLGEAAGQ